jgi:hypothetical protein
MYICVRVSILSLYLRVVRSYLVHGEVYGQYISYTVYNCPNTEKYRVNKIHIGLGCLARYEFYWPDIFRVTNLSWFCNQTSYLMFPILGQWIYHNFESIQPCISSFSFPWDMEFVMVLSPYFTSDSYFSY